MSDFCIPDSHMSRNKLQKLGFYENLHNFRHYCM